MLLSPNFTKMWHWILAEKLILLKNLFVRCTLSIPSCPFCTWQERDFQKYGYTCSLVLVKLKLRFQEIRTFRNQKKFRPKFCPMTLKGQWFFKKSLSIYASSWALTLTWIHKYNFSQSLIRTSFKRLGMDIQMGWEIGIL